jgi:hypothetical protein
VRSGTKADKEIDVEMRNVVEVAGRGGVPEYASGGEDFVSSEAGSKGTTDAHASSVENSHTYYFGASMITLGRFRETVEKGYFAKGEARTDEEETIMEPMEDKDVIFEDFFLACLWMHVHLVLADILSKFQAQLH